MASSISLNVLAKTHVAGEICLEREVERLLGESGHGEEFVLECDKLLLEVDAGHGESLFQVQISIF